MQIEKINLKSLNKRESRWGFCRFRGKLHPRLVIRFTQELARLASEKDGLHHKPANDPGRQMIPAGK